MRESVGSTGPLTSTVNNIKLLPNALGPQRRPIGDEVNAAGLISHRGPVVSPVGPLEGRNDRAAVNLELGGAVGELGDAGDDLVYGPGASGLIEGDEGAEGLSPRSPLGRRVRQRQLYVVVRVLSASVEREPVDSRRLRLRHVRRPLLCRLSVRYPHHVVRENETLAPGVLAG